MRRLILKFVFFGLKHFLIWFTVCLNHVPKMYLLCDKLPFKSISDAEIIEFAILIKNISRMENFFFFLHGPSFRSPSSKFSKLQIKAANFCNYTASDCLNNYSADPWHANTALYSLNYCTCRYALTYMSELIILCCQLCKEGLLINSVKFTDSMKISYSFAIKTIKEWS